jgi:hypothetical protein
MEERDHIDKALAFIEQTQKIGDQLKKAETAVLILYTHTRTKVSEDIILFAVQERER